jgi:UDP:flavonoid glycosyltransferase YjiC (YdhE family)
MMGEPSMRLLFTSCPLYGHVNTMLPMALAAQRAGHDVVFATGPDLVPHIEQRGLTAWPVGPTHAEAGGSASADWLAYFSSSADKRAVDLVPRAMSWRPDVVIREETELAGTLVAESVGARPVVHGLGLMTPFRMWGWFEHTIGELYQRWGVRVPASTVRDAAFLDVCPPALQPAGERIWSRVHPLRPVPGRPVPGDRLPGAIATLPHARTVHLTLGTVFYDNRQVLATALAGLRGLAVNVVVTVGPGVDPGVFGPQPAHVVIEPYLSHALLLPRCDLVVSQGGAGIMFGALAHGLPQLLLPQGADQFINADACRNAGVALSLAGAEVTVENVAASVTRLLTEPSFAARAGAVRVEVESMPCADDVLTALVGRP